MGGVFRGEGEGGARACWPPHAAWLSAASAARGQAHQQQRSAHKCKRTASAPATSAEHSTSARPPVKLKASTGFQASAAQATRGSARARPLRRGIAPVKLKASMGFQASALVLVCMTSLRMGVAERRSKSAMPRSDPVVANTSGSAGLKRTAWGEAGEARWMGGVTSWAVQRAGGGRTAPPLRRADALQPPRRPGSTPASRALALAGAAPHPR